MNNYTWQPERVRRGRTSSEPHAPYATQPALLDVATAPIIEPSYAPGSSIEERFRQFHDANPHVYRQLRDMALELHSRGVRRYGLKALYEVLRYERAIATHGDEFRLNNNYTAHYARLIMDETPALVGFFETREREER